MRPAIRAPARTCCWCRAADEGTAIASDLEFIEYACDQLGGAGHITYRRMFGEAAVYCHGKVVALICDNRLFVKPTPGGRSVIGRVVEGFPYPGAKPHFLIEERLDDREFLTGLIRITHAELPPPKPKKPRRQASSR